MENDRAEEEWKPPYVTPLRKIINDLAQAIGKDYRDLTNLSNKRFYILLFISLSALSLSVANFFVS